MIPDLKDKVILITGASTGIGAATARAFAANGARVAVHYNRSREAAEKVAADIQAMDSEAFLVGGDVTDTAAIQNVIAQTIKNFGHIDVLINNAGALVARSPIADITDQLYEDIMRLNVYSVVAASREIVPHFRKQGRGNIINVTSIAARNGGGNGAVLYAAAKGFVSTATRGWARELAKDKIRVNAVSPGTIDTPFHERYSTAQQLAGAVATIPMDRLGTSEECTGAFLFLASDVLSNYVTGQILEVNGGQYMP